MDAEFAPKQHWWSAEEIAAACLPGLPGTKQGVNFFAKQQGWRQKPGAIMRKPGRGGGILYHWSVLPVNARLKLLQQDAEQPAARLDRGAAWAAFEALAQKSKDEAVKRLDTLDKVEALHLSGSTHVQAVDVIAAEKGVSPRTVYNWIALVEGVAREDRLAYLTPRPPKKRASKEDRAQYQPFPGSGERRGKRPAFRRGLCRQPARRQAGKLRQPRHQGL